MYDTEYDTAYYKLYYTEYYTLLGWDIVWHPPDTVTGSWEGRGLTFCWYASTDSLFQISFVFYHLRESFFVRIIYNCILGTTIKSSCVDTKLQRWLFFHNDGMVMNFFEDTIAINGFSMVLLPLNHHHWMFFHWLTIDINGFSMVFTKVWHDGQQWFWPVQKT